MKKSILYTGTGDKGKTSLVGGQRVDKTDIRIEAYGTVDELNSYIGLIASYAEGDEKIYPELIKIQHRLFDIGAELATLTPPEQQPANDVSEIHIEELERKIDEIDGILPPLQRFILPGGSIPSSHTQIARTVCRRAERRVLSLAEKSPVSGNIVKYLNRLSDFLFALARYFNFKSGSSEIFWVKED